MTKKDVLYLLFIYCLKNKDKAKKGSLFDLYDFVLGCYEFSYNYEELMNNLLSRSLPFFGCKIVHDFIKFVEKFEKICK